MKEIDKQKPCTCNISFGIKTLGSPPCLFHNEIALNPAKIVYPSDFEKKFNSLAKHGQPK